MSGHSKWHSIKHKKALIDSKRGRSFTKFIKEITIAARFGGGDPEATPACAKPSPTRRLSTCRPTISKRAIMKGTGELDGGQLDEITYEGYGPGGVAIIVDVVTDNRNRTVSEIRHLFSKNGGNMGESGCVSWMFKKKGYIVIDASKADEDSLMNLAIEAGADDFQNDVETYEIYTTPENFDPVLEA
jgi:DNA-binding regulatory protein, YebC/PmpR family